MYASQTRVKDKKEELIQRLNITIQGAISIDADNAPLFIQWRNELRHGLPLSPEFRPWLAGHWRFHRKKDAEYAAYLRKLLSTSEAWKPQIKHQN